MRRLKMPEAAIKRHRAAFSPMIQSALEGLVSNAPTAEVKEYYKHLLDFHERNDLSVADPFLLQVAIYQSDFWLDYLKVDRKTVTGKKSDLYKVIDYLLFSKRGTSWNNYAYIDLLDIKVCPYCNASLIVPDTSYPALDHYFPHSAYPFLGLSLYNLIPVCDACNKPSSKGRKYLWMGENAHPFVDDISRQIRFEDKLKSISAWSSGLSNNDVEIAIQRREDCLSDRGRNFCENVKIPKMYSTRHIQVVRGVLADIYKYSMDFVNTMDAEFRNIGLRYHPLYFEGKRLSESDILAYQFCKMKIDLCRQYHIE